jgi:hypothetical protein
MSISVSMAHHQLNNGNGMKISIVSISESVCNNNVKISAIISANVIMKSNGNGNNHLMAINNNKISSK